MFRWLTAAVLDWLLIAAAFVAIWLHPLWTILPAVILIGSRQHALVVLGHEGGHNLVAKNKRVNDLLTTTLCFSPLFFPLGGWRAFHNAHHRHMGDDERDPELEHKSRFSPAYDPPFTMGKLVSLAVTDMLGRGLLEIPYLVRIVWRGAAKTDALWIASWWIVALGLCIWMGGLWIAAVWLYCYSFSTWAIFRIRAVTEHPFLTRTPRFAKPSLLLRALIFPHGVWMHWEHHRRPGLPFYRLPEVRVRYPKPPISDRLFA